MFQLSYIKHLHFKKVILIFYTHTQIQSFICIEELVLTRINDTFKIRFRTVNLLKMYFKAENYPHNDFS